MKFKITIHPSVWNLSSVISFTDKTNKDPKLLLPSKDSPAKQSEEPIFCADSQMPNPYRTPLKMPTILHSLLFTRQLKELSSDHTAKDWKNQLSYSVLLPLVRLRHQTLNFTFQKIHLWRFSQLISCKVGTYSTVHVNWGWVVWN